MVNYCSVRMFLIVYVIDRVYRHFNSPKYAVCLNMYKVWVNFKLEKLVIQWMNSLTIKDEMQIRQTHLQQ